MAPACPSSVAVGPWPHDGANRDPLQGTERVLIDGNNLLHALRRGPDGGPAAALVGRLRAAFPPSVAIEIVFDGPPDPGSGNVRVASGVTVRYAGRQTADMLLVHLVGDAARFAIDSGAGILVVTDDTALGAELRRRGARTAGTRWLAGRLARPASAPSVGLRRPPLAPADDRDAIEGERRWEPGRGATAKRGNPRRRARNAPSRGQR